MAKKPAPDTREGRLAKALRTNLKRRKQAARAAGAQKDAGQGKPAKP